MKRVIALVLELLLVTDVCFGAENEMILGHLTKLGVDEETLNAELAEPFFSLTPFARFKYFNTLYGMAAALMSRRIAAFDIDKHTVDYIISRTKRYAVLNLPKVPDCNVSFSMLLCEEDKELCGRISSAIRDMKADGTLAAMKKKYIDDCIAGTYPETVKPEHFDGAMTFKVALTGDHPPMDYFADAGDPIGFNNREGWESEDRPEHTIITEPYLDSKLVYITLSDSPLLQK